MLILGSSSPRRKEILSRTMLKFRTVQIDFNEVFPDEGTIYEKVMSVALAKAKEIYKNQPSEDIVISADTIIYLEGEIFGKPKTSEDAFNMLMKLNNKSHSVITGVSIVTEGEEITFYEESFVTFKNNDVKEIEKYSQTREVLDKAGSYAIQGFAVHFIEKYEGDYNNIMGLPLAHLCEKLRPFLNLDE
ncbi:MAG: Maf family protein [bacterium]